eukprot:538164-Prorocentrum_minimum.AAC.1
MGKFSLPFYDWCPLWVYSLSPSAISSVSSRRVLDQVLASNARGVTPLIGSLWGVWGPSGVLAISGGEFGDIVGWDTRQRRRLWHTNVADEAVYAPPPGQSHASPIVPPSNRADPSGR